MVFLSFLLRIPTHILRWNIQLLRFVIVVAVFYCVLNRKSWALNSLFSYMILRVEKPEDVKREVKKTGRSIDSMERSKMSKLRISFPLSSNEKPDVYVST